jgi:peptidoglycan/LPS O-acetylase OafA/YrhL
MDTKNKHRLLGVDLVRGIATLAVIFIHSPFDHVPYNPESMVFQNIFLFAVPFFLATAFYFYALKPSAAMNREFWRLRFQRIMIPYLLWSLIYFCIQFFIFFGRSHKVEKLTALLADPVGIIFLGGAFGHLYFLPLLFSGTALTILGYYLHKSRVNISILAGLAAFSLVLYKVLLDLDFLFRWDQLFAFRALLDSWQLLEPWHTFFRLILVLLSWWVLCLPYLLGSMMIVKVVQSLDDLKTIQQSRIRWLVLFSSMVYLFIYMAFYRATSLDLGVILTAYVLLVMGIFFSPYLKESKLIQSVSLCSFGIYLIHQPVLFYIVRKLIIAKLLPDLAAQGSILSMVVSSSLCFLLSWLSVAILIRNRVIARYLFGLF